MKKIFLLILVGMLLVLNSCQEEIEIEIPNYRNKLVVEGSIENGAYPMVIITKSIPYFSTLDPSVLFNEVVVTDAVVTVTSSTGETERLSLVYTEDSPIYFAYVGDSLKGECNKSYSLKIEWENKTYTANTSIVNTFNLDSIWFSNSAEMLTDSMRTIRLLLTDNPLTKDYYRFLVKVHGINLTDRLWVYTLPLVFDDGTFNGQTFNFELLRGTPSSIYASTMSEEELSEYYRLTYRPGDTVFVKYSLLDYNSYHFWSTISSEITFGQNPFMSPAPIEGNVICSSGEAVLGSWCGYASQMDTMIFNPVK